MRNHALSFLQSCMVGIGIKTDTKPFAPHGKFYKMLTPQAKMWAQRWFGQLLTTLELMVNTGINQTVPQIPSQGYPQQPILGGGVIGGHKKNVLQINATELQSVLIQVADKGSNRSTEGTSEEKVDTTFKVYDRNKILMQCI